jgi:hypothetical protein
MHVKIYIYKKTKGQWNPLVFNSNQANEFSLSFHAHKIPSIINPQGYSRVMREFNPHMLIYIFYYYYPLL